MTPDAAILLEQRQDNGVLLLTLNRPAQRNALATPLLEAIAAALRAADRDNGIRCVVITGNDKVFAAGADIEELARSDGSEPVEGPRWIAWNAIAAFSKPLIAAVEGWCLGAGSELMLRCDIVVAGRNAKLGQPETNLGIIPGAGGTAILPRKVGMATAMDMVLTGEPITGERAYQLGMVARLVDDGQALASGLELAARLASRAPEALRVAKASILHSSESALGDHLRVERERFLGLLAGAEKAEGIAAFREKRPPDWSDF
ncbi:MAG TPA: enoyl-CoA hydratase-related protein, partial [Rhizorhapis sp.]|nr:enoyl-CoA hydratase-related protein [Rhizorhapis sp.]